MKYIVILIIVFLNACTSNVQMTKDEPCVESIVEDCITTREYKPVCGCNGKTYSNPSVAKCSGVTEFTMGPCGDEAYKLNKVDSLTVKEECVEIVDSTCVTTLEYDPVCGCNGKTYSSPSQARCNNITKFTKGTCEEEEED